MSIKHSNTPPALLDPWHSPSRGWIRFLALAAGMLTACAPTTPDREVRANASAGPPVSPVIAPDVIDDPLEPLNRGLWGVNRGLLEGVFEPTGEIYQAVVPKPVRTSVNHFTSNLLYPGRLVNTTLQGRWNDAGSESLRFLCNSTAGVGGLFDVATKWNIPRREAYFAQTFQQWGWKPGSFLMLPFFGPSDEVHAAGLACDEVMEPWNYASPYREISYATTYNRYVETTGDLVRFIRSEADPYDSSKLVWTYASKNESPDWAVRGPRDIPTLETLGAAAIQLKDPDFLKKGRQASVRISATGRRLPFNYWVQKAPAPLVYVAPGLGSHRLSMTTLSVAEALYQNGFSVVSTTSVFHPEFMERAATTPIPGHPPTDCHDLHAALTAIDAMLARHHPGQFGARALVGCSMGAFHTLYLAAREKQTDPGLLRFDRYVAINSPVDLHYGIACLDRFHDAPLAWPEAKRQTYVNNTVHKVGGLALLPPSPGMVPPFDGVESKFLIGLAFRFTLRDAIYSSQARHNQGVLRNPVSYWRRDPVYNEILGFSYRDYATRLLFPYYQSKGIGVGDFKIYANLRNFGTVLRNQPKARLITNRNDFLLSPGDLGWLESVIGRPHMKVFPNGGHLGNLASPEVQGALVGFLSDLK